MPPRPGRPRWPYCQTMRRCFGSTITTRSLKSSLIAIFPFGSMIARDGWSSARQPEAGPRRVDVEQAEGSTAGAEPVLDVRRHREERAGADAVPLAVLEELDLALQHVERVGVVGVGVGVDAFEIRPVRELERLDVRQLGEDAVVPDALALPRSREERLVHRRAS